MSQKGRQASVSPSKESEDKDKTILKLRSNIRQLQEYSISVPALIKTKRHLMDLIELATGDMKRQQIEMTSEFNTSNRVIADVQAQKNYLKSQLDNLHQMLTDLRETEAQLKQAASRVDTESHHLRSRVDTAAQQQQKYAQESTKLVQTLSLLDQEVIQLFRKTEQLQRKVQSVEQKEAQVRQNMSLIQQENKQMYHALEKYEQVNNKMQEDRVSRQYATQNNQNQIKKTEETVRSQLESILKLQQKKIALMQKITAKKAMAQYEQTTRKQLQSHIRNTMIHVGSAQICYTDAQTLVRNEKEEVKKMESEIRQINQANTKMLKDRELCHQHMENILLHNQDLNRHIEKFAQDDELIIKIVTVHRKLGGIQKSNGSPRRL